MSRLYYLLLLLLLWGLGLSAQAQQTPTPPPPAPGVSVQCPAGGPAITNAIEVVVNIRPGFSYTATALGLDSFDPVMAIVDDGRVVACVDDSPDSARARVTLPTTGQVMPSTLNARMEFSHNYDDFADISVVVGGFGGSTGEFVLILEGMTVTSDDGAGDPFRVNFTPNMLYAEVDMSVYMLGVAPALDALMRLVIEDETLYECDDAGTEFCQEGTARLTGARLTRANGRTLNGAASDAMLTIPTTQLTDVDFSQPLYLPFLMTSHGRTQGDYVVLFHFGIGLADERSA